MRYRRTGCLGGHGMVDGIYFGVWFLGGLCFLGGVLRVNLESFWFSCVVNLIYTLFWPYMG